MLLSQLPVLYHYPVHKLRYLIYPYTPSAQCNACQRVTFAKHVLTNSIGILDSERGFLTDRSQASDASQLPNTEAKLLSLLGAKHDWMFSSHNEILALSFCSLCGIFIVLIYWGSALLTLMQMRSLNYLSLFYTLLHICRSCLH